MKAYGAVMYISMSSWQRHWLELSASRLGRFIPGERAPVPIVFRWLGGPQSRSGQRWEKSWLYQDSNSDLSTFQPVATRYTNCTIPASYFQHSTVVMAQCYKPEGRGFKTRWSEWIFSIYLILPAALGPGAFSAEQKWIPEAEKSCFWGAERGRCVELTALPPSLSRLSRQCLILNIYQTYRHPRPVTGISSLFLLLHPNILLSHMHTLSITTPIICRQVFEQPLGINMSTSGQWDAGKRRQHGIHVISAKSAVTTYLNPSLLRYGSDTTVFTRSQVDSRHLDTRLLRMYRTAWCHCEASWKSNIRQISV
jgi:hypothetical protein